MDIEALLQIDPDADVLAFQRAAFTPFDQRWNGDGPMPLQRLLGGALVPRLPDIHPRRWQEVMWPLSSVLRSAAARQPRMTTHELEAAMALRHKLPPPPAADGYRAVPVVAADRPAERLRPRQVNVRLSGDEHRQLSAAAELMGTSPTTLARMLILNGARKVLADQAAITGERAT
jgi:hypothetical protein